MTHNTPHSFPETPTPAQSPTFAERLFAAARMEMAREAQAKAATQAQAKQ
ncbi:MAG: hypothetical protein RSE32_13170 [Comamonas sp.]